MPTIQKTSGVFGEIYYKTKIQIIMRLIFAILIIVVMFCIADGGTIAEIIGWVAGGIIAILLLIGVLAGILKGIIFFFLTK